MIDLDYLLYGNPDWNYVVNAFMENSFPDERYLVDAIEKHLLTEEQRKLLFENGLDVVKILNGRWENSIQRENVIKQIYSDWNERLGFVSFGRGYGWF
jgi:hypothetical protein